jgi:hypothetical protein
MPRLTYTKTPYGRVPAKEVLPSHVRPIATAPTNGAAIVNVYEPDGTAHRAAFHGGSWVKTEERYDPYSGRTKVMMTSERVAQPVAWSSS